MFRSALPAQLAPQKDAVDRRGEQQQNDCNRQHPHGPIMGEPEPIDDEDSSYTSRRHDDYRLKRALDTEVEATSP